MVVVVHGSGSGSSLGSSIAALPRLLRVSITKSLQSIDGLPKMGVVIIYVLYSRARNLGRHFVGQKCHQVPVSSAPVDTVKRRKLSLFRFPRESE